MTEEQFLKQIKQAYCEFFDATIFHITQFETSKSRSDNTEKTLVVLVFDNPGIYAHESRLEIPKVLNYETVESVFKEKEKQ